ncbi:MAG: hypothetical protein ACP5HH_08115, partial [Fervidicoccaceae archaeon]
LNTSQTKNTRIHIVKESTRPILQKTRETLNRTPQTKSEPSLIAKITHYTKLDCILTYTREKEAERILNKTSKNDTKNRESG